MHTPPNKPGLLVWLIRTERLRRRLGFSLTATLRLLAGELEAELDVRRRAAAMEDADHPRWAYGQ